MIVFLKTPLLLKITTVLTLFTLIVVLLARLLIVSGVMQRRACIKCSATLAWYYYINNGYINKSSKHYSILYSKVSELGHTSITEVFT